MHVTEKQRAHRILVLNAKGGCGKTTIATNLACQYASEHHQTALIDYDPQASSTQWLDSRPKGLPTIHCIAAGHKSGLTTRTWQLRVPMGTTRIIVDTPARLDAMTAARLIRESDTILIPVLASPIDIRAATQFLAELTKYPEYRNSNKRIAVVGNRVRKNTKSYAQLLSFLHELDIPFISSLRDTQNYVRAAEEGVGVQELKLKSAQPDCAQWYSLVRWIEGEREAEIA
jgi:chromosome partitioning protein